LACSDDAHIAHYFAAGDSLCSATPIGVITYMASQLNIPDPQCLVRYAERLQTQQDHAQEIRHYSGYKEFSNRCGGFALMRFLYARIWNGTTECAF
jgi:hypothetical protein